MIADFPNESIKKFIRLGGAHISKSSDFNKIIKAIDEDDYINKLDHINQCVWERWEYRTKELSVSDYIKLIKGITLAEAYHGWSSGSVAPVRWFFPYFELVADEKCVKEIVEWVFKHRTNIYVPFGTSRYVTYEQYLYEQSDEYYEAIKRKEQEVQEAVRRRKERKSELAAEHIKRAKVRSDTRSVLILQLNTMSPVEKWNLIANTKDVTIKYYPVEWVNELITVFKELSETTQQNLIERVQYVRKGPWKKVKNLLGQSEFPQKSD
jgi:hypothetical protein